MLDIASLGLEVNTSQIVEGKAALDQFAEASARVDQKVGALNGQMNDTAKIMKSAADAAKAADDANVKFMATLEREIAVFGMGRGELEKYKAAELGLGSAAQAKAMALGMSIDAMHREEAEMRALAATQDRATASADQFIKKLQEQVATLGMNAQQLQSYRAAQLGVSDAAAPLIAKLGEAGQGAHGASKHMDTLNFSTVGARRELLVLAHELSQGNYSKFGGSMMVLGEQTGAAGLLFSATGLAALAFAGALAAVGYAMIKGASDQKHMNDALVMTGDYAGVTSDQLNSLAHAAVEAGGSLGEAKKVVTELAGSGKFTGEQINYITEATVAWEHATGASVKSIIKDFESLAVQAVGTGARATEAISRAVLKLDDQYHFLTEAVYEQIRALEKEGDAKGASALATETFAKATHDRAEEILGNLGTIARGWNAIKEAIGQAGDAVGAFGARTTPASEVAKQSTRLKMFDEGIAGSNQRLGRPADSMSPDLSAARNRMVLELTAAVSKLNEADAAAIAKGQEARAQSAGVHAAYMLAASDAKHLKDTKLELALASNKEYEASVRAANPDSPLISAKAIEERRLQAIKENTPKAPKAKVDQVESTELADQLARIQGKVSAEKQMYDTMSKMDDMFHAAGKMGDEEYYSNKRAQLTGLASFQIDAYGQQVTALKNYQNTTAAEAAKHAKQINDIEEKKKAAGDKLQDDQNLLDAAMGLRKDAILSASDDALNKYLSGLGEEAKKLELANQAHETSRSKLEQEAVARLDVAVAQQQQFVAGQNSENSTEKEIAQGARVLKFLEDERAARARIAAGLEEREANQFKDKAADQAIKDWQRAGQSIASSLSDAFGEGGKALGGMFQAYAKGMEGQLRAQKELAAAKKLAADNPEKIDAINRAQLAGAQSQIQSYAGMTSAAQGFFSEGSRGYQAMHAATVALQGAEIALSLIKGVNAVLTQGEGDPYTAFGRMAAMAAIVAGLGVAISAGGGGGGGKSAADVQKAQGTGSVFGDSSAKSDSISRSIEQLKANSDNMLPINQGMLSALKNIEASMAGLTNLVVRTPGLTDGSNLGIQTGTIKQSLQINPAVGAAAGGAAAGAYLGSMAGAFLGPVGIALGAVLGGVVGGIASKVVSLWGKTTQNIVDSGLQYGGSVRGLQQGQGFDQYASIDTTKKSFFGLSKKTSNSVQTEGLNDELSKQFGLIFTNLDKSLQAASVALGGSAADVTKVLDNLTLESSKVSLKGLTGTALTDALNSVISKSMDEIAQAAFPQFDAFRKVGEGYAETVMRLAGDYAKLDSILAASSTTFGATGIASVGARERLIELTGGIEAMASQTSKFTEGFLSKAEQLAPVQKYVTDQLAAMGLQSLDTRDKFKDYVLGLANSGKLATEAGAQQYASLLALSEAFAKTHAATVDLTKSEQEIADERKDLQGKLDDLMMTQAQLATKARAAIDGHNLALYDQVIAATAAKDAAQALLSNVDSAFATLQKVVEREKAANATAHTAEMKAIQARIDTSTASVTKLKSLSDALKSSLDGMNVAGTADGDARTVGQAQIQAALAIVKAGGPLPTADSLKQALSSITKDASDKFTTYDDYLTDFYKTQSDIAALGKASDAALSVEQKTLDLLGVQKDENQAAYDAELARLNDLVETTRTQIDVLKGMDTSLLTINQSLQAVLGAIAQAQANPIASAPGSITKSYQDALGRAPDKAGMEFWQQQVANGGSLSNIDAAIKGSGEAKIQDLYKNLLGRTADAGGMDYWLKALNSGASLSSIEASIKSNAEYQNAHKVPGFATGGDFAGGLRLVGEHGPELEATGPSRIFNAGQTASMLRGAGSGSSNAELIAELRAQRQENAQLSNQLREVVESHLYAIAKNTLNTADTLEAAAVGDVPLATKEIE